MQIVPASPCTLKRSGGSREKELRLIFSDCKHISWKDQNQTNQTNKYFLCSNRSVHLFSSVLLKNYKKMFRLQSDRICFSFRRTVHAVICKWSVRIYPRTIDFIACPRILIMLSSVSLCWLQHGLHSAALMHVRHSIRHFEIWLACP